MSRKGLKADGTLRKGCRYLKGGRVVCKKKTSSRKGKKCKFGVSKTTGKCLKRPRRR